jgi:hypothetical protein
MPTAKLLILLGITIRNQQVAGSIVWVVARRAYPVGILFLKSDPASTEPMVAGRLQ